MTLKTNTATDFRAITVDMAEVRPDQRAGDPVSTGATELAAIGGADVGIWEMTVGAMRDVEADEFFVVLSGTATVEFDDGSPALHLSAGSVARLSAGAATRWTVTETLRKVYVTPATPAPA